MSVWTIDVSWIIRWGANRLGASSCVKEFSKSATENLERLLIVDDEESILAVVSDYFRRKGYRVRTAPNGAEALQLLKDHEFDCCFTDIHMPQMDGLELAERIRQVDNTLPVIVMTGYPSVDSSIRTLKNGVVDFLVKPVNLKHMELSLRRVMRQRTLFMENLLLKNELKAKERIETLNRELLSKVEELDILNCIMGHFTDASSTANVFQRTVEIAQKVIRADTASFFVIHSSVGQPVEVASAQHEQEGSEVSAETGQRDPATNPFGIEPGKDLRQLIASVAADGLPLLVTPKLAEQRRLDGYGSIMAVPVKIRERLFGVLIAGAQVGGRVFSEKDLFYLSFTTQKAGSAIETLALYDNLYENLFATLFAFVNALEARDLYTRQHSSRVTDLALILGRELGCSADELNILNFAGPLHDIGKIGIRDDILLKPDRLTAEEFEKIKEHPVIGANMLSQLGLWDEERRIIRCHHERFDGRGYPDGLKEAEIPFLARILSLADAYDAMASDRAYRKRMEPGLILRIIQEGAGTQFDPRVVEAFQKAHRAGKIFSPTLSGETG
jgi:putative nucleotidyltransferase with HDIG domain